MSNRGPAAMRKRTSDFERSRKNKGTKKPVKSLDARVKSVIKKFDKFFDKFLVFDEKITSHFAVCASKESKWGHLRPVMKLIEITCHGVPWLLSVVTSLLLSRDQPTQVKLVNLLAGLIFDLALVGLLKFIFVRQRPKHNRMDMFATISVDNYSFPSGHATRAAMVTWFFIDQWNLNFLSRVFFMLWMVIVSSSRIALGRHHVSDVFAGIIIGILEYKMISRYWLSDQLCLSMLSPIYKYFIS